MSEELKLAVVAAASALLGTIIGGVVAYYTNRGLQDREFRRADRMRLSQAKAGAAVELNRVITARELVEAMMESHLYPPPGDRLEEELTITERQVVIANMSSSGIRAYSEMRLCIDELRSDIARRPGDTVSQFARLRLRQYERCFRRGELALTPLAEHRLE